MRVIYIHGLHSSPKPEKVKILEDIGLEVIAPKIDYEKEQEKVYPRIKKLVLKEQVNALIGSSLGGFVSYWLARELNKPALLFNPALYFESMRPFIPKLDSAYKPPLYVCSGEKDETVVPELLKAYLAEKHSGDENLKILSANWLAHGIDLRTFRSMTSWFLAEIEN